MIKEMETDEQKIAWLEANGYLRPGAVIDREAMEKVLCLPFADNFTWVGPMLAFREVLEMQGFFITQRGQPEGHIRLLNVDEMALHCKKRWEAQCRQTNKRATVMLRADTSSLDEDEQKRHDFEINKLARLSVQLNDITQRVKHS